MEGVITMNQTGEILLVDKDRVEANQISNILLNAGHYVSCVHTGLEAIENVKVSPPDLVLSDFGLPDFDGIHLTRSLKQINDDLYVVLMGEWPTIEFVKSAMMTGAYDVLTKPVKADALCSLVGSILVAKNLRLKKMDVRPDYTKVQEISNAVFDEQGLWVSPLPDGEYMIGIAIQGWVDSGKLVYITPPEVGKEVRKGDTLFELVSCEGKAGKIHRMLSPMNGVVTEVNEDILSELARAVCSGSCSPSPWLTPVLKIKPSK